MKKNIILILSGLLITISSFTQDYNPVLMKIDGKEIRKTEFLSIYTKNNDNPKFDKESIDEYLKLFIKYKLKVADAEYLKIDTIPKLKNEILARDGKVVIRPDSGDPVKIICGDIF